MAAALTTILNVICALWLLALTRGWWRLRKLLQELHQLRTQDMAVEDPVRRRWPIG